MNRRTLLSTLLAGSLAVPAFATNGMNLIGYGACSALLAGGRMGNVNPTAMVGNPALLAGIDRPMLCTSLTLLMPTLSYRDNANPSAVDGESAVFPLPYVGYARPMGEKWVLGVCGYAQGGMGVDFQDLNTAFGTQDDLYSNVAYLRGTAGFGYKASANTQIGLSVSVGYAMLEFDYFPNTVAPDWNQDGMPDFIGMSAKDLSSFGYNARLGFASYTQDRRFGFGAFFGTKADVNFDNGTLTFATDLPGGANDFDLAFKDFSWPAEIGASTMVKVTPRWTLLADLVHTAWSGAVDAPYMKTGNGMVDSMLPPFQMKWQDRTTVSVSTKFKLTEKAVLLAGYNRAASPVKDNYLNALFPAIVEQHVTCGLSYVLGDWKLMGGVEYAPEVYQENPAPYGASDYFGMMDAVVHHSQVSLHVGFSKSF